MWCIDCHFRIEDKNVIPNPFYAEKDDQTETEQEKSHQPSLGELLAALREKKKK
jgi:hypothetical protein